MATPALALEKSDECLKVDRRRESAIVRSLARAPLGTLLIELIRDLRRQMSERDNESFDLDDEFLSGPTEDGTDYDRLLDRVDKRVRNQGKRGKAAWSRLEEVLADKKLEKDLKDFDDEL
ncbi:MAG TPA: hypothetical protein VK650_08915 [Steroidobacteraceae bacterium]|nr:hypothetical protein [Steroidobacteraceae bacterium]